MHCVCCVAGGVFRQRRLFVRTVIIFLLTRGKANMLKYLSHKLRTEANIDGNNVQEKVGTIQFSIYIILCLTLFRREYIHSVSTCMMTMSVV